MSTTQISQSQFAALAALVLFFILYAAPSLWFGLAGGDDFQILRASLWQPRPPEENLFWRFIYWRPLTMLSYSFTAGISDTIFAQRLVNLVLFVLSVVLAFRHISHHKYWLLILLAAFLHPSFIYPLTWIAQRNDLLLIIFAILALANIDRRRGLAYLALSDMAKSPFGFHNLLFAYHACRRQSAPWVALASLLLLAFVLYGGYISYYVLNLEMEVKHGSYLLAEGGGIITWFLSQLTRFPKFLENWIMIFVPFPATFGSLFFIPFATLYLVIWAIITREALRDLAVSRRTLYMLVTALLMSIPFAFSTGLRVISPVVPFAYIGIFSLASPTRLFRTMLVGLIVLNLTGSLLNYRVTDTGCYDLAADSQFCMKRQTPIEGWGQERMHIVDELVRRVKSIL